MPSPAAPADLQLSAQPGHYIRRLQQIAVAIFLEETADTGITPVQFAAMQAIAQQPLIDQRSLARTIGFDTSTIGGVIDRLEARGWVLRNASPEDRRVRLLSLTADGAQLLAEVQPGMLRAQERILAPLPVADRKRFLKMLALLVQANNELSRAPSDGG